MSIRQKSPKSDNFILTLRTNHLHNKWLNIKRAYKHLFPEVNNALVTLVTDIGNIKAVFKMYESRWSPWLEGGNLPVWFENHKELKGGDQVHITAIEPKRKFGLEIVK